MPRARERERKKERARASLLAVAASQEIFKSFIKKTHHSKQPEQPTM